ncbi:UDP-N-acetylglucosamine transferase subunit ALG13 [Rhynchospora pubera]|uniref:UDP-N-acetylglucosamine transferase subunit ALG13 n=1 Tax=Rhynchospora pubera TaxID=906938 RepID=A0AAV8C3S6_9POAL|nr:UDP-N-acetylglucosamine transferase subunit ALG13 [Rhynchospora pubera]
MGKRREVTRFDKLVTAADSESVKSALLRRGFSHLQIPLSLSLPGQQIEADHLKAASLVITHAGSESIFEILRLGKPLIVVGNEGSMDNHQTELAQELANRKHLFFVRGPHLLAQTIDSMDLESIVP